MPGRYPSRICLVIILVFFTGTCAPAFAVDSGTIEAQRISPEYAKNLADAALLEFILSGSPGLDPDSWYGSVINQKPDIIYDINGEPLFYQFEVDKADIPIGGMKIGASRVLPSSVMTIELTPPYWNNEETVDNAVTSFISTCQNCTIISSYPVCYDYPKIGQKIIFEQPGSSNAEEVILDLATSVPVSQGSSWSYYGTITDGTVPVNEAAWTEEEIIHRLVLEKAKTYGYSETTILSQEKMQALRNTTTSYYRAGSGGAIVQGSGEATTTGTGKKVLSVTLYPQEETDWCGVAAIQMISDYFNAYYSQNEIARWTNTMGGIYVEDEVKFFRNHLNKQETYADYDPSFQKEVFEINNNQPFGSNVESFSIVGGHARVGAGYNDEWGRSEIYIYDPWPVNKGSIYWEAYSSVNHICDVYIRGADTAMVQPPVAQFRYVFSGTTVTFTDLSTENPSAWYWTFGDGSTSTIQNPTHTYAQSGTYWVSLTVSNSGGSSRTIFAVYIPTNAPVPTTVPTTSPTVSPNLYPTISPKVYPTAVPTTSSTVSPNLYPTISPKVYPTAVPTTSPTVSPNLYPTISPKVYPTAVPTTSPTVSPNLYPTISPKVYPTIVPVTISTVYPTLPPKVYPTTSPISLPTNSPSVSPTPTSTGFPFNIQVQPANPVASFQYWVSGRMVTFMDTSTASPTSCSWAFGDGSTSTTRNPSHIYSGDGTYTITLTVSNSAGSSSTSKTIAISAVGSVPIQKVFW